MNTRALPFSMRRHEYAEIPVGVEYLKHLEKLYNAELAEYAAQRPRWVSSLEFRILASKSFDAIAVSDLERFHHLIGIHLGSILVIQDLVGASPSSPRALRRILATCRVKRHFSGYFNRSTFGSID